MEVYGPSITRRHSKITRIRTAYIFQQELCLGALSEEYSEYSGKTNWVIHPYYPNVDELYRRCGFVWEVIPGIDVDLRKTEYVRNIIPVIVSQRTWTRPREDMYYVWERIGMTKLDMFETMCRTHGICGNNPVYISRDMDTIVDLDGDRWAQLDLRETDWENYGWLDHPYTVDEIHQHYRETIPFLKDAIFEEQLPEID